MIRFIRPARWVARFLFSASNPSKTHCSTGMGFMGIVAGSNPISMMAVWMAPTINTLTLSPSQSRREPRHPTWMPKKKLSRKPLNRMGTAARMRRRARLDFKPKMRSPPPDFQAVPKNMVHSYLSLFISMQECRAGNIGECEGPCYATTWWTASSIRPGCLKLHRKATSIHWRLIVVCVVPCCDGLDRLFAVELPSPSVAASRSGSGSANPCTELLTVKPDSSCVRLEFWRDTARCRYLWPSKRAGVWQQDFARGMSKRREEHESS
jgi:hypothetical protein